LKNQEVIILAAIKQFNKHGIQGASISMIAESARLAKGTLYYYYHTKEELIEDAFAYVQNNAKEMSLNYVDTSGTPEQTVKQMVRNSLVWPLKYPEQLQFMESYLSLYFYDNRSYQLFPLGIFNQITITSDMQAALKPGIPLDLLNFIVGNILTNFCKYIITNPTYAKDTAFIESVAQAVWDLVSR
jgi:AcrR family transcriptional regulator